MEDQNDMSNLKIVLFIVFCTLGEWIIPRFSPFRKVEKNFENLNFQEKLLKYSSILKEKRGKLRLYCIFSENIVDKKHKI